MFFSPTLITTDGLLGFIHCSHAYVFFFFLPSINRKVTTMFLATNVHIFPQVKVRIYVISCLSISMRKKFGEKKKKRNFNKSQRIYQIICNSRTNDKSLDYINWIVARGNLLFFCISTLSRF